ncbi:MAG: FkbM family methyltransferase [Pirellulaceae bacterium]
MSLFAFPSRPVAAHDYAISPLHASAVPVLFGPLTGQRWLPFSGGKILRLMLGRYEPDQSALIARSLGPGDVFYDVGAAVGYYSLLAARRVGEHGYVVAFEPDVRNAAFLRRHVIVNQLTNVELHQVAVSDRSGLEQFSRGTGTGTGHLSEMGDSCVHVCRLDDIVQDTPPPTHIKIDVEGAEQRVLEGAMGILVGARPIIFLSVHGPEMKANCQRLLRGLEYELEPMSQDPKHSDEWICLPT